MALVGSGDAGVYAMASPALQEAGDDIDVTVVPGITASLAAAALLGAPLGHDHAVISLSDLHTPWEVIERRVRAAAEADFVTVLYNPRSHGRDWQLGVALAILARHRPPPTPAGARRHLAKPIQRITGRKALPADAPPLGPPAPQAATPWVPRQPGTPERQVSSAASSCSAKWRA